jgi:hypothetical protein
VPTLWARTTGAADGVGVGVGVAEADGDAVATGPLVEPPHAASATAEHAATAAIRNQCTMAITADRYTVKTWTWPFSTLTCSEGNGESGLE